MKERHEYLRAVCEFPERILGNVNYVVKCRTLPKCLEGLSFSIKTRIKGSTIIPENMRRFSLSPATKETKVPLGKFQLSKSHPKS